MSGGFRPSSKGQVSSWKRSCHFPKVFCFFPQTWLFQVNFPFLVFPSQVYLYIPLFWNLKLDVQTIWDTLEDFLHFEVLAPFGLWGRDCISVVYFFFIFLNFLSPILVVNLVMAHLLNSALEFKRGWCSLSGWIINYLKSKTCLSKLFLVDFIRNLT